MTGTMRDKDATIVELAARLLADLGEIPVELADHWEADRFAFGVARVGQPDQLAYISTWEQPAGTCFLELESSAAPDDPAVYRVVGKAETVSYDELVDRVKRHLAEPNGSG